MSVVKMYMKYFIIGPKYCYRVITFGEHAKYREPNNVDKRLGTIIKSLIKTVKLPINV